MSPIDFQGAWEKCITILKSVCVCVCVFVERSNDKADKSLENKLILDIYIST
jgi:hypothetical protein